MLHSHTCLLEKLTLQLRANLSIYVEKNSESSVLQQTVEHQSLILKEVSQPEQP